jgi:putative N6-adenine-specific DNA methylase
MYAYQKDGLHTAQVADGLEELLRDELMELGARQCEPGFRFVRFVADHEVLYRIVYRSRLATRILTPLLHFPCPTDKALYEAGRDIRWSDFLGPEQTFAITANVSESAIGHSQYAALKLKDAVADWFRDHGGRRPSVDPRDPDLWLNLHIRHDQATISLDASGGSMHRRGYRVVGVEAPMNETVAAAVIRMSGWNGETTLVDPLCGSGTILCEAFMHGADIPAGFLRQRFGFTHLPDFQPELWDEESDLPLGLDRSLSLHGGDIDAQAVEASRANLDRLPGGDAVLVERQDFFTRTDLAGATIVCNPPYGIRLGKDEDLSLWFKRFGDHLKRHCQGATAFVYFGDRQWLKHVGLRPDWKKPLKNGGLDGRLAKFSLY